MVDDPLSPSNAGAAGDLPALGLGAYREAVALDVRFVPTAEPAPAGELDDLARTALGLLAEDPAAERLGPAIQLTAAPDPRQTLAALLTVRPPGPLGPDVVVLLDALLGGERELRPVVDASGLPTIAASHPASRYPVAERTVLWRGDIRALGVDAIVNAANSSLLGCFVPGHACIDNAIHSAAGPRLRDDCETIMSLQAEPEPVGAAKITRGYHLPARYVLHTVGPVVDGDVTDGHEAALASSYRSCLDVAADVEDIRTVAFCAISTGVFGYPSGAAAPVALRTVGEWLERHPSRFDRVVFDVYGAADEAAYDEALSCAGS